MSAVARATGTAHGAGQRGLAFGVVAYRALDRSGTLVAGSLPAANRQDALEKLRDMSLLPVEVTEGAPADTPPSAPVWRSRPRRDEITQMTRDLALFLDCGVALDQALLAIARSGVRPAVADLVTALNRSVSAGKSFAAALREHPRAFAPAYCAMVEVAEHSGSLSGTLALIARERARAEALGRRMRSALAYPAFLVCASIAVLAFVLGSVVPEFERAFVGLGTPEGPAASIFALSQWWSAHASTAAMAMVATAAAIFLSLRFAPARRRAFGLIARAPGISRLVALEQAVTVSSTLRTLMASGVDITTSLRLLEGLVRDDRSARGIERTIRGVRQGRTLGEMFGEAGLLPADALHMLRVGEETAQVATALGNIARIFEERLDRRLARLTAVLGPAILVLVSALIAWIIVSVMTALMSMNELLLAGGRFHADAFVA